MTQKQRKEGLNTMTNHQRERDADLIRDAMLNRHRRCSSTTGRPRLNRPTDRVDDGLCLVAWMIGTCIAAAAVACVAIVIEYTGWMGFTQ